MKDLPHFALCLGYFSSNNFVVSVLTFPKNRDITNKPAISSAGLFPFSFISELRKALIYTPA